MNGSDILEVVQTASNMLVTKNIENKEVLLRTLGEDMTDRVNLAVRFFDESPVDIKNDILTLSSFSREVCKEPIEEYLDSIGYDRSKLSVLANDLKTVRDGLDILSSICAISGKEHDDNAEKEIRNAREGLSTVLSENLTTIDSLSLKKKGVRNKLIREVNTVLVKSFSLEIKEKVRLYPYILKECNDILNNVPCASKLSKFIEDSTIDMVHKIYPIITRSNSPRKATYV